MVAVVVALRLIGLAEQQMLVAAGPHGGDLAVVAFRKLAGMPMISG